MKAKKISRNIALGGATVLVWIAVAMLLPDRNFLAGSETPIDGPPSICLSPTSLVCSCLEGQNAPNQTFEVWNCGDDTLSYAIECDSGGWQPYADRYALIVMGGNEPPGSPLY